MKLSKHRRSNVPVLNMTPMIDVVFLLLIFFMTVTQVSKINRENVELPELKGSEDQRPTVMTINVDREGRIAVSGNKVSVAAVVNMVVDELAKLGDDPNRLTVVLRADRRGDCRTVNRLVAALAKLQVNRVRIAVEVPRS